MMTTKRAMERDAAAPAAYACWPFGLLPLRMAVGFVAIVRPSVPYGLVARSLVVPRISHSARPVQDRHDACGGTVNTADATVGRLQATRGGGGATLRRIDHELVQGCVSNIQRNNLDG